MKKFFAMVLALAMILAMAACAGSNSTAPETTVATTEAASAKEPLTQSLEQLVEDIYAQQSVEFMVGTIPVDLADAEGSLFYFTGLTSAEGIKEAVASEAMIGSIPYSMVLVKVEDAANAKAVAETMKSGIDQRKWICVEADDLQVSGYCDVVMLVMISSDYAADGVSAQAMTDAFQAVCGAELDFTI